MSRIQEEIENTPPDNFGFQKISESIVGEREERLQQVARGQEFGVKFLDETLRAIEVDDLILIGALPGIGKTELVTTIALKNAQKGKRVHLFALEAGQREIERRMKFKIIMQLYYAHTKDYGFKIAYYDWYRGAASDRLQTFEDEAERELLKITNLNIFYRRHKFGVEEFRRVFLGISKQTDLVIVDHLHYFSLEDDNENRGVKQIMMEMRDLVLLAQVPIILVAHLRKADKTLVSLAPELSEFHGTSEIGKIVTKAVTLGPGPHVKDGIYTTFARVAKCRQDSGVSRFLLKVFWDSKLTQYRKEYFIGNEIQTRTERRFEVIDSEDESKRPLFLESKKHYKEDGGG